MQNSHEASYALPKLGVIRIAGVDAARFLQGQITINSDSITPSELKLGTVCNPKGRCIALFWATRKDDDILFILPRATIEDTLSHFKKYAVFFKVELTDESSNFAITGGSGSEQSEIEANGIGRWAIEATPLWLALNPADAPTDAAAETMQEQWFCQLAQYRIPWLEQAAQAEFLPHNLNLPSLNAIDFKKGCFTGQEVIARMQYKGKLKSHMQLLTCEEPHSVAATSQLLVGDKKAGEVICSSHSESSGTWVLALIKDSQLQADKFLISESSAPLLELKLVNPE